MMISQNYAYSYSTGKADTDSEEFGDGTCDGCGSRIRSKCERGYDHCVVCSGGSA